MSERKVQTEEHSKHAVDGSLDLYYDSHNAFYNMDYKYRGKALIFSHDIFDFNAVTRIGNDKDLQRLEKCLIELSFIVEVFHNLKSTDIMEEIEKTANMNHSENDCLLIAVLTHGEAFRRLCARDTHYDAELLWCPFTDENCPTLAGKPKIFIIQACQGDNSDHGITLTKKNIETDGECGWFDPHYVPVHRDFLVAHSSVPGYYSWRDHNYGAWFIQSLCDQLENSVRKKEMDILTLLTFVNQNVALNYETVDDDIKFVKQIPYFSSMLTRRLILKRKY